MEKKKSLATAALIGIHTHGGLSSGSFLPNKDIGAIMPAAAGNVIKGTTQKPLDFADLDTEMKEKIRVKYAELKHQFPHMKHGRLIKKVGEFLKLKLILE